MNYELLLRKSGGLISLGKQHPWNHASTFYCTFIAWTLQVFYFFAFFQLIRFWPNNRNLHGSVVSVFVHTFDRFGYLARQNRLIPFYMFSNRIDHLHNQKKTSIFILSFFSHTISNNTRHNTTRTWQKND